MDTELHKKYIDVELPDKFIKMYADIIESDPVFLKVFKKISKETFKKTENELGITANDLVNTLIVDRKVMVRERKGNKFEPAQANIQRKQAEKWIDTLLSMGLCYYRALKPYKYIYVTVRGRQVAVEISNRTIVQNKEESLNDRL